MHVAGVHLERRGQRGGNAAAARETLGDAFCLLRTAYWQEGLAVAASRRVRSVQRAVDGRLRRVGREPGSAVANSRTNSFPAARPNALPVGIGIGRGRGAGWADVGVCVRLVSEEAGLDFLSVREEAFDFCFPAEWQGDPRVPGIGGNGAIAHLSLRSLETCPATMSRRRGSWNGLIAIDFRRGEHCAGFNCPACLTASGGPAGRSVPKAL